MTISVLERMTAEIDQLSFADQLLLIERFVGHHCRNPTLLMN